MKVLLLGAYGLIGAACFRALRRRGMDVVGAGRSSEQARRLAPQVDWIIADLAKVGAADWATHLAGVDAVVNAAGALQDGARDDLAGIHERMIRRILDAAPDGLPFIQISSAGASETASTAFMRTKGRGDAALMASPLTWTVLRPTLVVDRNAYGGTALLRGVAGVPLIAPALPFHSEVQTIALEDLAEAVADCVEGRMPPHAIYDLTEEDGRSLGATITAFRQWLGFPPAAALVPAPRIALSLTGWIADGLGWLGWRSPLRSTALRTLRDGVRGDPGPWRKAGGRRLRSLDETLAALPATRQERLFARLYLVLPLILGTLSMFWLASGLIGAWRFTEAASVLTTRGVAPGVAAAFVALGSAVDCLLGLAILIRRFARPACFGMAAVSAGYLIGATGLAPDLWSDPLGPMVKVFPALMLSLTAAAMLEER